MSLHKYFSSPWVCKGSVGCELQKAGRSCQKLHKLLLQLRRSAVCGSVVSMYCLTLWQSDMKCSFIASKDIRWTKRATPPQLFCMCALNRCPYVTPDLKKRTAHCIWCEKGDAPICHLQMFAVFRNVVASNTVPVFVLGTELLTSIDLEAAFLLLQHFVCLLGNILYTDRSCCSAHKSGIPALFCSYTRLGVCKRAGSDSLFQRSIEGWKSVAIMIMIGTWMASVLCGFHSSYRICICVARVCLPPGQHVGKSHHLIFLFLPPCQAHRSWACSWEHGPITWTHPVNPRSACAAGGPIWNRIISKHTLIKSAG